MNIHKINEEWGFSVDKNNNHTPYLWVEAREYKGRSIPAGWRSCDKYFKNEVLLLRWIISQELSDIPSCDLDSYIAKLESLCEKYLGDK